MVQQLIKTSDVTLNTSDKFQEGIIFHIQWKFPEKIAEYIFEFQEHQF